jgi:shikimate kinase
VKLHVVLVGLSGSGKTAAGERAAKQLDAPLVDIDRQIESTAGKSIAEIFTERGEAAFRDAERAAVARALEGEPAILVPGGGWATQPGNLDQVTRNVFIIYLNTTPAEAARRLALATDRPLLEGDREAILGGQLAERKTSYEQANACIETTGMTVQEVADRVAVLARKSAGW